MVVAKTRAELINGDRWLGADAAIDGNISTAPAATMANPSKSVRRVSSRRDVMICTPLMIMKVTVKSRADTTTERGMIASNAVSLGQNPSRRKTMPTTNATDLLVTPLAAASPTPGVDVLLPTAPATPAPAVVNP